MKFIKLIFLISLSFSARAEMINLDRFHNISLDSWNEVALHSMTKEQGIGGDLVGNGGGLAEKNILFSHVNLKGYIEICLNSPTCKLNTWEKNLLNKILNGLPDEVDQVKFVSEKNNPGFFRIDGELKLAKTGDEVGSPIFINSDLLYTKNSQGLYKAFGISEAVALLIHEMGHHHGAKNHNKLDLLGIKVSMSLENHSDKASLFPHNQNFMAISVNKQNAQEFPQLLVYFDSTFMDISKEFRKALKCRGLYFFLGQSKPHGASFHNMFWKKLSRRFDVYEFTVSGNVSTYCKGEPFNPTQLKATSVDIKFKLEIVRDRNKRSGLKWEYIEDSLKIKQNRKKWWSAFKVPDTDGITGLFPL